MIPAHVPSHLVYDFDFLADPKFSPDPHAYIRTVVESAPPIFYTPRNGGHWVFARYPVIADASRNTALFSSRHLGIPLSEHEPIQIPINLDPPEHGVFRDVLAKAFSPKAMNALEMDIRTFTNQLIDRVVEQGRCDFLPTVAEPLPVTIFMRLMGMPLERLSEFRGWVKAVMSSADLEQRQRILLQIMQAMSELVDARRVRRQDDLISRLLDLQVYERALTHEEMLSYCLLLFIAGLDTVVNGMSFGVRHLAGDPALQQQLREHPERIPDAVEELLRRYSIANPGRIVTGEGEFHGVQFKKDDMVLLLLAAANLDEGEFAQPTTFDLDRENKRHIAFNVGPHRCVGSHLARMELRILYEEWLRRVPEFKLDPAQPAQFNPGFVLGVTSLPLIWSVA